ncbi:TBC1 domain family member 1 [Hondaea fermentalgiana]|uniref:TBC1 domain family member 1 n=1 Tax=Hondaea fermentalgiana TaxID=2315210 RepID=A0A2R5G7M4_9STRA|nr:TBC1 domain family member 1 [Hondaea fermentalgiana]|eukprot:GBG27000.1 TBC1 domain family member 1 [Hondaea fermentalgiana]
MSASVGGAVSSEQAHLKAGEPLASGATASSPSTPDRLFGAAEFEGDGKGEGTEESNVKRPPEQLKGDASPQSAKGRHGSFFFATGAKWSPPASPTGDRKRGSNLGVLSSLDLDLHRKPRNSSGLKETVLERFEHAEELRKHRNTKLWCYWGMSKEHKELEFIRNWKTRLVARSGALKQTCRHGSLDSAERRSTWLSMADVNVVSKTFKNTVTTYDIVFREKVASCPGCKELHMDHLHNFGARFLRNGGSLWSENLFEKHLLAPEGIKCAKRLMLVLHAKWAIDYCPQIPDMVSICLLYLTEQETFAVIDGILARSRASKRWSSDTEGVLVIPVGKADALVFVRTFVSLFKERLPALYRNLLDLGRDADELDQVVLNWFERFFVGTFPVRYVVRIFDCYMVEGPKVLYRVALTLLKNARSQLLVECAKRKRGEVALSEIIEGVLRSLGVAPDHHNHHSRSAHTIEKQGSRSPSYRLLDFSSATEGGPLATNSRGSRASRMSNLSKEPWAPPSSEASTSSLGKLHDLFSSQSMIDAFIEDDEKASGGEENDDAASASSSDSSLDGIVVKNEAAIEAESPVETGSAKSTEDRFLDVVRSTSLSAHVTRQDFDDDDDLDREEGLLSPRPGSKSGPRGNLLAAQSERFNDVFGVDADGEVLDDPGSPMSPRFLKSVQLEPMSMIEGASTAEYNIAANNLTLRARRHSAPRGVIPFGLDAQAPPENQVIVVEKKYGSKTFYSESSLYKSDSVAGAALMERMIGADVANTRLLHAPQQDSFEFKVFLSGCFSWRSIKRKSLAKYDETSRRIVKADPFARISDPVPTLHFPRHFLDQSAILKNVDMATRLVGWLPLKAQYKFFRQIKLLYTTDRDGRSLDALYEACGKHRVTWTILLIDSGLEASIGSLAFGNVDDAGLGFTSVYDSITAAGNCKSGKVFELAAFGNGTGFCAGNKREQDGKFWTSAVPVAELSKHAHHHLLALNIVHTFWSQMSDGSDLASPGSGSEAPTARQTFLAEHSDEIAHLQESAARTRFVTCSIRSIEFGGRSTAFVSKQGKRVSREEVQDMSDEQFSALELKKELAGPGLTLDQLLDEASSSWCSAYENRPLCMSTDVVSALSTDLIRSFRMGTVEVFGI